MMGLACYVRRMVIVPADGRLAKYLLTKSIIYWERSFSMGILHFQMSHRQRHRWLFVPIWFGRSLHSELPQKTEIVEGSFVCCPL